jgi:hypothetical protein
LIYTNVSYDDELLVVRHAAGIPHGGNAAKIGDAVGIRIHEIKRRILAGRTGKELVEKPVRWQYVSARKRNWLNGKIGYWIDLGPEGNAGS